MALTEKRKWLVWVTGTIYHGEGFNRWANASKDSQKKLVLRRIKDNPHDRSAIAVCHGALQIGWVARENAQVIGPLMDQGHHFDVAIHTLDRGNWDPHKMLRIVINEQEALTVTAPSKPPPPLPPLEGTYLFTGEIGESSGHRAVILQQGKLYRLRTAQFRSSVDLIEEGGGQAGWVRKADLPCWNTIADRLDRFYAVVEGRALYLSEDINRLSPYLKLSPPEPGNTGIGISFVSDSFAPEYEMHVSGANPSTVKVKPGDRILYSAETNQITVKETTMNFNAKSIIAKLIDTNKRVAATAGYLEAGRIANNAVANFLVGRLSWLERFFNRKHLQSPAGKLVIANGALLLAAQLRPDDERVKKLTEAMATQAYQEIYQQVDIEGMIDNLMNSPDIQRALRKLGDENPVKMPAPRTE